MNAQQCFLTMMWAKLSLLLHSLLLYAILSTVTQISC